MFTGHAPNTPFVSIIKRIGVVVRSFVRVFGLLGKKKTLLGMGESSRDSVFVFVFLCVILF